MVNREIGTWWRTGNDTRGNRNVSAMEQE